MFYNVAQNGRNAGGVLHGDRNHIAYVLDVRLLCNRILLIYSYEPISKPGHHPCSKSLIQSGKT